MSQDVEDRATLGGLVGRGYAVVESLASLGKGRRLTGLFKTAPEHKSRLSAELKARQRVLFDGPVHFRHHSRRAALEVELARIEEEQGQLLVEFTAQDVPYAL
ncbi:MAG: hypothetical protein EXR95_09850 [Gemmatimonadetes bacterium]|nr:hypothetical protein [Gemmatimonadota bacterium]